MTVFQNSLVAFRCPTSLKERMIAFAEDNEQHLSSILRVACVEYLRRHSAQVSSQRDLFAAGSQAISQ